MIRKKYIIRLLLLLLFSIEKSIIAKQKLTFEKNIEKAEELILKKDFITASTIIKKNLKEFKNDKNVPQAKYLLALCEFYMNNLDNAKSIFLDIIQSKKNKETLFYAKFYLSFILAKEKNYKESINYLKEIIKKKYFINVDKNLLKRYFASFAEEISILEEMIDIFNFDEKIQELIWEEINKIRIDDRNFDNFNSLVKNFSLIPIEYKNLKKKPSKKKDTYNIVVFHSIDENNYENYRNEASFCRGIDFADYLLQEEENIKNKFSIHFIKLSTDDELNEKLKKLENLSIDCIFFLANADFIRIVSDFSSKENIPLIDFVSTDTCVIKNNYYHFLIHTTLLTFCKKIKSILELENENFNNFKVIIIDSFDEAKNLKERKFLIEDLKNLNNDIKIDTIYLNNNKASTLINKFARYQKKKEEELIDEITIFSEATHIIFLENNKFIHTTILSLLNGLKNFKVKIIFTKEVSAKINDLESLLNFKSYHFISAILKKKNIELEINHLFKEFSKRYEKNIFNEEAMIGYFLSKFIIESMVRLGEKFILEFFEGEINLDDVGKIKYDFFRDNQAIEILELSKEEYKKIF